MLNTIYDSVGYVPVITPVDPNNTTSTLRYSLSVPVENVKTVLFVVKRYGTATDVIHTLKAQFSTAAAAEGASAPTGATDITGAAFSTTELAVSGTFDGVTGNASIVMLEIDVEACSQQTTTLNASTYTHMNLAYSLAADNGVNTLYAFAVTKPRYAYKSLSFTTAAAYTTNVKKIG